MIPVTEDNFNGSYGEQQVFIALRDGLPKEYTVFHSFRWNLQHAGRVEWGEADFTVFHPEYGILVIEVKSGGILLENGKWWYKSGDKRYPMKDPLEQASRTKFFIKDLIEDALPEGEYCWVEPIVWFPSLSHKELIGTLPNTYHSETVLWEWALQNTNRAIQNAYQFYNSVNHTRISPESVKLVVRALAPAFSAVPSLNSVYEEQEYRFLRLTNEQSSLLDFLDEQPTAAIQGGAGTGKTLLAVEKARRLSADSRVLFLCFNRFLMDELRRHNQGYNIAFYNLPSLVVHDTNLPSMPTDSEVQEYLDRYDADGYWDYKHIIIDEGQDFNDAHVSTLATIAEMQGGVFYVFYDKHQLVQRQEVPEWVRNAECRIVLRRNCRNTMKIATTAGRPIEVTPILWEHSPDGNTPDFYIVNDLASLIRKMGELVSKYVAAHVPLNQITILTTKTEERSVLAGVEKVGKWSLSSLRNAPGAVLFTTARKFKGLESSVVLMVDVDASTFASFEGRNLFYVGASRAKHFLDIVTILDGEQVEGFSEALTGSRSGKGSAAKIAATLKVRIIKE